MPALDAPRETWLLFARRLAVFTILYNVVEGLVSVGFGVADGSVALSGFGADSFIEVGSALIVLWRLREEGGCASTRLKRERNATLGIGILFVLLAVGAGLASVLQLVARRHPDTTLPGFAVAFVSLVFMFGLWKAKRRAARALDSRTLEGDAACSLACIQLSLVLFVGSLGFLVLPALWWADALAALAIAVLIAKEGLSGIRAALHPEFSGGCGCH
jgi:divalent metal cation (Fe/Co/Zn/Cd) transporter